MPVVRAELAVLHAPRGRVRVLLPARVREAVMPPSAVVVFIRKDGSCASLTMRFFEPWEPTNWEALRFVLLRAVKARAVVAYCDPPLHN